MLKKIRLMQEASSVLEPDPEQRDQLLRQVDGYAQRFLTGLSDAPAFVDSAAKGSGLLAAGIGEEGIGLEGALALLAEHVDRPGVNPASARFLGYIPGGGLYYSALGDYLAAVANRYAGHFFASPGAVRMENMLLAWMAGLAHFPETWAGNLTSGGSVANLTGIVTARDAHEIGGEAAQRTVVYLSEHTHHSVDKALRIAGLARCVVRRVPVDDRLRMSATSLEQIVKADLAADLRPWLLVASAGSTNTGSVDPLQELAQIARAYNLWFHVDGAYGGFFLLTEQGQKLMRGIEAADSLVMDPHKTLFLPYGTGAILVRDRKWLLATHHSTADYMQDTFHAVEEISPADTSPELTKHFRGLRLWLPLIVNGVAPFRAALEEKLLLTRYFFEAIQRVDGFEVGPAPDLSVATYRYVPARGDANRFNARLVEALQKDGRIFVSSTMIDSKFVLRAAIGSFRTHLEHVDAAISVLAEKARQLEEG